MSLAWYRDIYGIDAVDAGVLNTPNGYSVPLHPGYDRTPGGIYIMGNGVLTGVTLSANVLHYSYFFVGQTFVTDAIVTRVSTASAGSARVGIYTVDNSSGLPSRLITQGNAVINTGTVGERITPTIINPLTLPPGWYISGLVCSVAAGFIGSTASPSVTLYRQPSFPAASNGCYAVNFTFGVLPDIAPAPTSLVATAVPVIGLRTV